MRALIRPAMLGVLVLASSVALAQEASSQKARIVEGDTLLIQRVAEEPANLPARGMRMAQVEARFGVPGDRLAPRGGQKRQWPTIERWRYPGFIVYFEHGRVIDAVATQASPDEIGPKPPTR